jgi:hypothetical protein
MLGELVEIKEEKPQTFQVMFLRNDCSQEVEVHEAEQVDFLKIQEHLERGESVFITSKNSQKLKAPREKDVRKVESKTNSRGQAFYFDHL